jgi:hypothetical protein
MPPCIKHGPPAAVHHDISGRAVVVYFGGILPAPRTLTAPTTTPRTTTATSYLIGDHADERQPDRRHPERRSTFEARRKRTGKPDLVARFGGIILRQDRRAVITDPAPVPVRVPRKELLMRLRKRECELCEAGTTVAVHQVTGLKELGKPGPGQPTWATLMARMRRKTLIVCAPCHDWIHANPVAHAA